MKTLSKFLQTEPVLVDPAPEQPVLACSGGLIYQL